MAARTTPPAGPLRRSKVLKRYRSQPPGSVRIIAGHWRGRRLPVPERAELRPTPDRLRETLFNWLQNHVPGADCLDLFAGTGALGFEAASRGARSVVLVERDRDLANALAQIKQTLQAADVEIVCQEALTWLRHCDRTFDIVFLDPPFRSDLLASSLALLASRAILRPGGTIYVELSRDEAIPSGWRIDKKTRAGRVQASLLRRAAEQEPI